MKRSEALGGLMKPTVRIEGPETETEAVEEPTASVKTALCCRLKAAPIPGGMARGFLCGYEHKLYPSHPHFSHYPSENPHVFPSIFALFKV